MSRGVCVNIEEVILYQMTTFLSNVPFIIFVCVLVLPALLELLFLYHLLAPDLGQITWSLSFLIHKTEIISKTQFMELRGLNEYL